MSSDIEICSNALVLLGEDPISSFTENVAAETCSDLYPSERNRILVGYPWRTTMKKIQLTQNATAPVNEWRYSYNLPADRIGIGVRAVYVGSSVDEKPDKAFEIFGDKLYFDADTCYVDYQHDPGETAYPPHLVALLEFAMAARLAEPITDSTEKAKHWFQMAFGTAVDQGKGGYYREARQLDAMGDSQKAIEDFSLIDARY